MNTKMVGDLPGDKILGMEVAPNLRDWEVFWLKLGWETDLGGVVIPKKRKGFDRLIVVPQGMTPQKAYDLCASKFKCWKYTSKNLDKAIVYEDRTAKDGAYAIWVRERVEADKEQKNRSANDLLAMKISGNTLTEALVYGLKFNDETGKHLNVSNWNLCSGSRYSGGGTPSVHWYDFDGEAYVGSVVSSDAYDYLRTREVVF